MSNLSIKMRVLLLTLTPLLIISLILGYYLARSRIQDSENSLHERGDALARHLARESEFGLFSEDSRQLGELATIAVREDDVFEITIQNADRKTVMHALSADLGGMFIGNPVHDDRLMRFVSPVYRSGITISDHEEQYSEIGDSSRASDGVIGWVEVKLSRANTLARQGEIIRNIVLMTLASSFLCALIALWMAKGIVQPIIRLSHAVDGIRKGRLGTRIDNESGGEIGELENGFNDMAAAMEKSQTLLYDEIANATNKLSLLLESLPVAVFRAEFSDRCELSFITPSIKQLTGFDADEFSNDCVLWMERMHPEDKEKILQYIPLLKESGSHEFEFRWQVKDGDYHWFYSYIKVHEIATGPGLQVIGLWQDITELKKVSQQLEHTISILQEKNNELDISRNEALLASRNKATFLANMSHEIRTPLSAVIGYAIKMEARLKTLEADDEIRECARIISHASAQLKRIIDDILSFSKLGSGSVNLDQVPFDLRADFEDVVCMMSSELGDRRVELSLLFDTDVPTRLVGDPGRINQVLMNLLSNAIKFTWNGCVDVHVSAKDASAERVELEVSVADTGIGMTEDVVKSIFRPFHQGDASIARRYGGTGLGLSIVSRLIGLWGGEIGVESTPGRGSRFWFTLKCLKQAPADDFIVDECIRQKKILLYDDHQPSLRSARNLLLAWSVNIYQARSRCQIKPMIDMAAAAGEPYDLVIIGAGIKDDEPGRIALNVLLNIIRESHEVPLLLLVNRQCPISLGRMLDDSISLVEKPVRRDTFYQRICRLLDLNMGNHAGAAVENSGEYPRYDGIRVLLAEDNEFNRTLITAILEARGLLVSQVHDGSLALSRAAEEDYDLVIMDIHLPGMDGTETARRLRRLKSCYETVPIIALTADVFFDTPENLASAGIDACLLKPLNEDTLWRLITSLRSAQAKCSVDRGTASGSAGHRPDAETALPSGSVERTSPPPSRDLAHVMPALAASLEDLGERMDDALHAADPASLRAILHELKGVVCYFGLSDLSHSVLEAEKLLNRGAGPGEVGVPLRMIRRQIADFSASCSDRLAEINLSE